MVNNGTYLLREVAQRAADVHAVNSVVQHARHRWCKHLGSGGNTGSGCIERRRRRVPHNIDVVETQVRLIHGTSGHPGGYDATERERCASTAHKSVPVQGRRAAVTGGTVIDLHSTTTVGDDERVRNLCGASRFTTRTVMNALVSLSNMKLLDLMFRKTPPWYRVVDPTAQIQIHVHYADP